MNCPRCGSVNTDNAKFCNQCGTALFDVYADKKGGKRRRVAVIFADISGFTTLSEELDPEKVRDLIDNYLRRLASIIYKYEGYIDKFIGDCIMALFGAPFTHEDDPLRAVLSAIDLMREIEKFNEENKLNLTLSIGVNYGLVATGDLGRPGEYTVMGDVVNLAQRLQSKAPKGAIYVSQSIYEQTKNEIEYERLPKIKVKGKREKVPIFKPIKIRKIYSLRKIEELPLIGRTKEINRLYDLFAEVKSGCGRVVSIVGEAGIGKSKLIFEFKKSLKNNVYLLEQRGIEYLSSSSYFVLRNLLHNLLDVDEGDPKNVMLGRLEDFIRKVHDQSLVKTVPFLKYLLALELERSDRDRFESMKPEDRMRLMYEAIRSFMLKISKTRPMIMVFEDCHWIDAETVDFMNFLAEEISSRPIMLINIYRPEFNIGAVSKLPNFYQINLNPLTPDETAALLHSILNSKDIDERLHKLLLEKSRSIPFYVHELVTNLLNNKIIFIEKGIAKLIEGMESAIPRTLDELIMTKIDRLDKGVRLVVDIASVIGDELPVKLLKALLTTNGRLRNNLSMLEQQGIIQSVKKIKMVGEEEKYIFRHSLIKEAIYQSLLKKTRSDYHRQIGYAIESVYKNNLPEYYDTLAHHFLVGEEKEKALEYIEKAADRKKELYLNQESITLYKKTLELIDHPLDARLPAIYGKLGQIYKLMGQYDEAKHAFVEMGRTGKEDALIQAKSLNARASILQLQGMFEQALEMLKKSKRILKSMKRLSIPEKIQLAEILRLECWIYRIKGQMNVAESKGLESIFLIKNVKSWYKNEELKRILELAYIALAVVYVTQGEYRKAVSLLNETLSIAKRIGHRQALGHVYNNLGIIYRSQGKFNKAIDAYMRKLKISEELGDKSGIGVAYCNLGIIYQYKNEYERSLDLLQKYLKISEELGDKQGIGQAYVNLGTLYYKQCDYEKAIKSFEKHVKISEELGDRWGMAIAFGNLGEAYLCKLDYKKAVTLFEEYMKKSRELDYKQGIGNALHCLGRVYAEVNNLKKAEKFLNAASRIISKLGKKTDVAELYNSISFLKLKEGKFNDALELAKKAQKMARESNSFDVEIYALINIGRIFGQLSRLSTCMEKTNLMEKYRKNFREAIVLAEKFKNKKMLADAYYEYASVLKTGEKVDQKLARKNFAKALKLYKKLNIKKRIKELQK